MSVTTQTTPAATALEVVAELGETLANAMNRLAALSRILAPQAKAQALRTVLPARRQAPAPIIVPPATPVRPVRPVLTPRYMPPVQQEVTARRVRTNGAAELILNGILSKTGMLVSEAKQIAPYVGGAYLDRLAQTHGFTWYETGEGDKRRFIANIPPPAPAPRRR